MAFPLQSNTREVPFYRFDWPTHSSCGSVMRSKLICSQGLARFSFFLPAVPTHLLPAGLASDMKNGAAFLPCVVTVDLN